MSKYLVISSDGHAGPPPEIYREYLEERFRQPFDEHQAAQEAGRMVNTAFVEEWTAETGDHEMRAGYDPAVRDRILDQEGVAAETLFPDADVLGTGKLASSPFGSGLASGVDADPDAIKAGAQAHNRWLADRRARARPGRQSGRGRPRPRPGRRSRRGRPRPRPGRRSRRGRPRPRPGRRRRRRDRGHRRVEPHAGVAVDRHRRRWRRPR